MADLGRLDSFDVGIGIRVTNLPNGRVAVTVDETPFDPKDRCVDTPSARTHAEEIAVSWLEQVAPHRLASLIREYQ